MIWTDTNYDYAATICQHTGKPCPALARLAKSLTHAVERAVAATGPDFELDGAIAVNGCARDCQARFSASRTRTRLFCDVAEDAPLPALDRLADVMLDDVDSAGFPSLSANQMPCAMLQADLRAMPAASAQAEMRV